MLNKICMIDGQETVRGHLSARVRLALAPLGGVRARGGGLRGACFGAALRRLQRALQPRQQARRIPALAAHLLDFGVELVDQRGHRRDSPAQHPAAKSEQVAEELEILPRGEPEVEAALFGAAQADLLAQPQRSGGRVDAVDPHRSSIGRGEARENLQDGALPGTVRADESEQLAAMHAEAHVLDGAEARRVAAMPQPGGDVVALRERFRQMVDDDAIVRRQRLIVDVACSQARPTHGRAGIGDLVPNRTIRLADSEVFLTIFAAIADLPTISCGEL